MFSAQGGHKRIDIIMRAIQPLYFPALRLLATANQFSSGKIEAS